MIGLAREAAPTTIAVARATAIGRLRVGYAQTISTPATTAATAVVACSIRTARAKAALPLAVTRIAVIDVTLARQWTGGPTIAVLHKRVGMTTS